MRLAKELVRAATLRRDRLNHSPTGDPAIDDPDQLLEVEVDGVRCILTRAAKAGPPDLRVERAPAQSDLLSPREQEIARMVMKGYPNKTIAAVLEISVWTVGTHVRRMFAKLGVGSRAAMVAKLLKDRDESDPPLNSELARQRSAAGAHERQVALKSGSVN